MAKYKIEIKRSAQKEIEHLPKMELKTILSAISQLRENPRGHQTLKLANQDRYRLRVGRYRVLYEIHEYDLMLFIVKVAHRKEAYR